MTACSQSHDIAELTLMPVLPCPLHAALLIEREPNNLQAQSLNSLIEKGVARGE